ncbi:S4 domain-containing protein, partial [Proteus mirabilis]|nr:S4 domain-containing protein [Proteus mirabilis]
MRLDKFLSQQLGISRNLVARELRAGLVTIDGEMVKTGATKITPEQEVAYDGNVLTQILGPRYFMLNKPIGYVCS